MNSEPFIEQYRMNRFLKYIGRVLCLLLLTSMSAVASGNLHFRPLNISSELPTNEIRNLYQDKEGYIWISTYNGLLRYDGYSILTYRSLDKKSGQDMDCFINAVCEDCHRRMWIGTQYGLYVLDKLTDEIQQIACPPLDAANIETVLATSHGDVYVGCNVGLYRKKAESDHFELCQVLDDREATHVDVKALMEDSKGHIWIGTWQQGLLRYDPSADRYYHYNGLNPRESSHALCQDNRGNIWVGTWLYGLLKLVNPYDMEHYSAVRYMHEKNNPHSIADNIIYTITQDRNTGKLWIGSRRGLSLLETEEGGGVFTNYLPENTQKGHLPFNEVNALLYSNDGLMWVGMLGGGVYTTHTQLQPFHHDPLTSLQQSLSTNSVRSIYRYANDELWMGIMGFGLIFYNPRTGKATPYNRHPAFKDLPYISTVNDMIYYSRTGEYCFATWDDGIWFYDGKNVRSLNYFNEPRLADNCIYTLLEDTNGNLWIGSRKGLFMYDAEGKLFSLKELTQETADLCSPIFRLTKDKTGNIWVATPNSGIWKISRNSSSEGYTARQYTVHLSNSNSTGAMTIYADSHGRIWAGANDNSLSLYDPSQDCFVQAFEKNIQRGELITSIIEDERKTLWFTTYSYMCHITGTNPDSLTVEVYTAEDGLQNHGFNRNACYKDENGILYFGSTNGLNYFRPSEITCPHSDSPIVITDLKIFGSSVRTHTEDIQRQLMDAPLDYANEIVLKHNQNNFSLHFSLLNYVNPQLNRFKYRLEGYDANWVITGSDQPFAHYSNLPAGTYTFQLQGANGNGVWSKEVRTVQIRILPSPWLSWWAWCIYAILFILATCYTYMEIKNRLRWKHAIEIARLQQQKQEEVNHAKLQFFTNITHELLSPLSIISASADELKVQYPNRKGLLQQITDNTLRLTRLIQQILEFRKVENAQQKLKVSQGNLTRFLKHATQAFAPLVRKKQLHIVLENCDTDYTGYFDFDKLDKIVYNLLSNAAKYTMEGGTITLKQEYDTERETFTFSLNNPGEPIPADKQAHLFERFYEGEYRKFHTIGTGIGLSLTKDLVNLHHGEISVHCDKETGNTFIVTLPVSLHAYSADEIDETLVMPDTEPDAAETEEAMKEESGSLTTSTADTRDGRPSVLLVDDDVALRKSLMRLLTAHYHVFEANNGLTALEVADKKDIDIIVSDVLMPVMDGITLCRRIKEKFETRHIPVILLTAKVSDEDRIKGYEAEADGYVCKPVSIHVLSAQIENCLRKQNKARTDARKTLVFATKDIHYTSMDETFLQRALDCVNSHLTDPSFDTTAFITQMGMSRTAFSDRLKQLTGMTPAAFISNVRLQTALKMLQSAPHVRVTDLAYAVGFNDPKYFTLCFRKKFGLAPREYVQQHIISKSNGHEEGGSGEKGA